MKKRMLAWLLALAMLLPVVPTGVLADDVPTSGTCGENLTWTLEDGVLTISGTGPMTDFDSTIDMPWYSDNFDITKVIIQQGVTTIGSRAFYGCSSLTSVSIPESVTSMGVDVFAGCSSLTSISIPESTPIGSAAFAGCSSLTSIGIPESATAIEYATFSGCSSLTSIIVPDSVTTIGNSAFAGCSSLTSISIPKSVTSILGFAFSNCSSLKDVYYTGSETEWKKISISGNNSYLTEATIHYNSTGAVATSFASGTGSEADPYLITNAAELIYLAETVNAGESFAGKFINITSDIYLNDTADYDDWSEHYAPQNIWNGMSDFCGTINGCNNTIYGLYMTSSDEEIGFINSTKSLANSASESARLAGTAFIKNLNFKDSYVKGKSNVGMIIGKAYSAQIENCTVSGAVSGDSNYIGGLIGYFSSGGNRGLSVINSKNYADISGGSYVGGLIGYSSVGNGMGSSESGNGNEKITVTDCVNYGNVSGTGKYVGGIAGEMSRSLNCGGLSIYNLGNENTVCGTENVGGILGYLYGGYAGATLQESYNCGNVSGKTSVGGIIGATYHSSISGIHTIKDVYNTGTISGNEKSGGIVGYLSQAYLLYGYNIGNVNGTGALVGAGQYNDLCNPYVKYSYYLNTNLKAAPVCQTIDVTNISEDTLMDENTFKKFDFNNTWTMGTNYPILVWQKHNDETPDSASQYIVDEVKKYTSDDLYAQYMEIVSADMTYETRMYRLNELFTNYGITDVWEGRKYVSNTSEQRAAYLALTTDELYIANGFEQMLNNTAKGQLFMRPILFADGLVFNNEINTWLSFSTLANGEYPGVAKYKDMLYSFMDATSERINVQNKVKLVSDLASNVTGVAKINADDIISRLNACETIEQEKAILDDCDKKEIWTELAEAKSGTTKDENGNILLNYKLDESSGFGQFAKAMGTATKTVSIVNMGIDDIRDLLELDSKLATYAQYERFLTDIVQNTDIAYQLRWAASIILDELDEGYLAEIKDIALDILEQTKFNKTVRDAVLNKLGAGSLTAWLSTIKIGAFFVNKIADVGSMVKKEAWVEGYVYLANAFSKQLEQAKQTFIANPTEANAWDFYYNYNILYMLRYEGEEAYLAMTKVNGILAWFSDFGYKEKQAAVEETLNMLENKCKFVFGDATALPESCKFASKAVINCPVDVDVYAQDGTLIASLKDGVKSDITNDYGRFAVVFQPYTEEYAKVICLNDDTPVDIKVTAVEDGLVDYQLSTAEDTQIYTFDKVELSAGDRLETNTDTSDGVTYQIFHNGESEPEEPVTLLPKDRDIYVPVESLNIVDNSLELAIGETKVVGLTVLPVDATNTTVDWVSSDESVVTVKNGTVTAVGEGTATIFVTPIDASDAQQEVSVTVAHHHDFVLQKTVSATCTEAGYDLYDCTCGETEQRNIVDAAGHQWDDGKATKQPTATEKGVTTYTCTTCGETRTEEIPATGSPAEPDKPTTPDGPTEPDKPSTPDVPTVPTITFVDVPAGAYYYDAVNWAVSKGITNGTGVDEQGNNYFSPDASCTRAQAVTFLWRAAGTPEPSSANNPFTDVPAGEYYYKAVLWAVEKGITKGVSDTEFSPNTTCNRAQIVTFLHRYEGEPKAEGQSFNDVPANEYYYAPVIWAVSKGVTNGTGGGNFSPMDDCTRGQIVTFLYRDMVQ